MFIVTNKLAKTLKAVKLAQESQQKREFTQSRRRAEETHERKQAIAELKAMGLWDMEATA